MAPSILCGFQQNESARSAPRMEGRCAADSRAPPPHAPSMCIQSPCRAQTSATSSNRSYPPRTVVPAVAPTKKGTRPSAAASTMAASRASVRMAPDASVGMPTRLSVPRPMSMADFLYE